MLLAQLIFSQVLALCYLSAGCSGALLSGLREGSRALQLLRGPAGAAAADLVISRTEALSKADKRKRLQGEAAGAGKAG
jgi:hypothetical protein